ncbi:integrase core domain-containing protein [Mycolicibacterium sp. SCSIO 43805]|uniref:integrase core domain-containing protein n=1 Tax=Mycolicibacterium sp. SCSIO 43805 TaxID=3378074 RepID=UPI003AB36514
MKWRFLKRYNSLAGTRPDALHPAGFRPRQNGHIEFFDNYLRRACLNRRCWNPLFESRVVFGEFKIEYNPHDRHSASGYLTPADYAAEFRCTPHGGLQHQLRTEPTKPTIWPSRLTIADS